MQRVLLFLALLPFLKYFSFFFWLNASSLYHIFHLFGVSFTAPRNCKKWREIMKNYNAKTQTLTSMPVHHTYRKKRNYKRTITSEKYSLFEKLCFSEWNFQVINIYNREFPLLFLQLLQSMIHVDPYQIFVSFTMHIKTQAYRIDMQTKKKRLIFLCIKIRLGHETKKFVWQTPKKECFLFK